MQFFSLIYRGSFTAESESSGVIDTAESVSAVSLTQQSSTVFDNAESEQVFVMTFNCF